MMNPVKLSIASDVRLVDLAHEVAERVAGLAGLGEEDGLNFGIAVREAVINAIVHGNKRDSALCVDVAFDVVGGALTAAVHDRGPGFDPASNPDPTRPENLLNTTGRGLLLVRSFCDDVDFRFHNGRGMEVVLRKRLD